MFVDPGDTYQVTLPVALVDEIPGISTAGITHGIPLPALAVGVVLLHQPSEVGDVDIFRGQPGTRTERHFERFYELVEPGRVDIRAKLGRGVADDSPILIDGHCLGSSIGLLSFDDDSLGALMGWCD